MGEREGERGCGGTGLKRKWSRRSGSEGEVEWARMETLRVGWAAIETLAIQLII